MAHYAACSETETSLQLYHDFVCCTVCMQFLPQVLGPVVEAWHQNVTDPLINEDTVSVLSMMAQYSACLIPLAQQVRLKIDLHNSF